ncbi:hypothetical protein OIU84_025974 [Salix udensis]|uniref:Uncharacterized protein n=1 Tax=Salix udensis TaxID=889485 RepID=A0AAD6KM34_9ROSI|nr:hypothetical protein OIU84_025974 [Salix udensis]
MGLHSTYLLGSAAHDREILSYLSHSPVNIVASKSPFSSNVDDAWQLAWPCERGNGIEAEVETGAVGEYLYVVYWREEEWKGSFSSTSDWWRIKVERLIKRSVAEDIPQAAGILKSGSWDEELSKTLSQLCCTY